MSRIFTLIAFFFTSCQHLAGQEGVSIPYKGGENQLRSDFFSFYAAYAGNDFIGCATGRKDSAGIYFIEIAFNNKNGVLQASVYGSQKPDDLTGLIHLFANQSLSNWNRRKVKRMRVVVPVMIIQSGAMLPDNVYVDTVSLTGVKSFGTGPYYLMKPIIRTFFCNPPDTE